MFRSKVVIVTGSSCGFGAGLAVNFAHEEASAVVIHGRDEGKLVKVKAKCEAASNGKAKVHIVVGDVRNEGVAEKIINETVLEFGRIDILINNAGVLMPNMVGEPSLAVLDELFAVNVRAVVELTQLAVPHLVRSSGNVVNVSSFTSLKHISGIAYYSMSKAAVDTFTRRMAVELGPKGVRVNAVNPGAFPETDLIDRQGMDNFHAREAPDVYPLRRVGKVDELVQAVSYLASDAASFVTGALLPVDAGYSAV